MQNHIMLASLDQEEVGAMQEYAGLCVDQRFEELEYEDDANWENYVHVWVSADRGSVCYT